MSTHRNGGLPELLPCPFCGGTSRLAHSEDQDGCYWAKIRCDECGAESRGKWASNRSETCPMFYTEVRDEWNRRASPSVGRDRYETLREATKTLERVEQSIRERREHYGIVGGVRVPDALDGATGSFTEGYQHGWNDFRDEVIRMNTVSLPGSVTQVIRDAIPMVAYAYDRGLVDAERVGRSLEEVLRLNHAAELEEVGYYVCRLENFADVLERRRYSDNSKFIREVAALLRRLAGSGKEK